MDLDLELARYSTPDRAVWFDSGDSGGCAALATRDQRGIEVRGFRGMTRQEKTKKQKEYHGENSPRKAKARKAR